MSANFDSFADKEFSNVTVSFSVQKKVYENGQYKYIAPEGSEFLTWNVYKGNEVIEGNKVINSDTLTKTGNGKEYTDHYLLEIIGPFDSSDLTNYRLVVKVSATDTSGGSVEDSEYFVFLICKLNTEIS